MNYALALILSLALHGQQSITLPNSMVTPQASPGSSAPPPPPVQALPPAAASGGLPGLGGGPLPGSGGGTVLPGGTVTLPNGVGLQPGQQLGQSAPQAPTEVDIDVVAFQGSATGNASLTMDDELKPMAKVLKTLTPNDTFKIIAHEKQKIPFGQETRFTVNGIYTAYVTPMQVRTPPEGGNLYDLQTRIEMLDGAKYVDALRARGEAAAHEALVLRGMPLANDELIVLVVVAPEGDGSQGSSGDDDSSEGQNEDQQQPQDKSGQQDQQQAKKDNKDKTSERDGESEGEQSAPELKGQEGEGQGEGEAENSPQMAQSKGEEQEGEAGDEGPKDMQTVEAILQNLEEKDRQEQRNARYRRSQVVIKGDWW